MATWGVDVAQDHNISGTTLRPENRCGVWPWSHRGPTGCDRSDVGCRDVFGDGSVKQKSMSGSVGWKGENYDPDRFIVDFGHMFHHLIGFVHLNLHSKMSKM